MLGLGTSIYADSLTVDTVQGTVHGKTINDGKVRAFLGLPYAAPPVGELRWKAPAPPSGWNGVRDAAQFAHRCEQWQIWTDYLFLDSGPSEDCLYLSVYAACKREIFKQAAGHGVDSRWRVYGRRRL